MKEEKNVEKRKRRSILGRMARHPKHTDWKW